MTQTSEQINAYHRDYRRKRRATDPAFRAKGLAATKRWSKKTLSSATTWPKIALSYAKRNAKIAGVPFDLTIEDIIVPAYCPVFGTPLVFGRANDPQGPSLDRRLPALGYVKGNVQVISRLANRLKDNVTDPDVFRRLANWMEC